MKPWLIILGAVILALLLIYGQESRYVVISEWI